MLRQLRTCPIQQRPYPMRQKIHPTCVSVIQKSLSAFQHLNKLSPRREQIVRYWLLHIVAVIIAGEWNERFVLQLFGVIQCRLP